VSEPGDSPKPGRRFRPVDRAEGSLEEQSGPDYATPHTDEDRTTKHLDDIARFGRSAARVVARGKGRFLDPEDDEQRRITRSILVDLASATNRLSDGFKATYPQIDWRGIYAVRVYITHDYDATNDQVVWWSISESLPEMLGILGLEDQSRHENLRSPDGSKPAKGVSQRSWVR